MTTPHAFSRDNPGITAPAGLRTVTLATGVPWSRDFLAADGAAVRYVEVIVPSSAGDGVEVSFNAVGAASASKLVVGPGGGGGSLPIVGHLTQLRMVQASGADIDVGLVVVWSTASAPAAHLDTPWIND